MAILTGDALGPEEDRTVWHYTDGNGFLGIVRTKSIWASSAVFLNDSAEVFEAFRIVRAIAREQKYGESQLACLEAALARAGDMRDHGDRLASINHKGVFVASFSSKCDDLSQWRSYAVGTGGSYCMGFAPSLLNQAGSPFGFTLVKVEYEVSTKKALIKPIVDRLMACVETLNLPAETILAQKGGWPLRDVPAHLVESIEAFARDIRLVAPRVKNSAFSGEAEWRMIQTGIAEKTDIDFRSVGVGLVPYFRIGIPDNDFYLRGLVVGPSPRIEKNFAAAAWAMQRLGGNCRLCSPSTIPFRNW